MEMAIIRPLVADPGHWGWHVIFQIVLGEIEIGRVLGREVSAEIPSSVSPLLLVRSIP
jgi:hypothetical protein